MPNIDKFVYCTQLKELLEAGQITGQSGKVFEQLNATSTENNLQVLRKIAFEIQPKNTLEIGLAFGASCLALAATHRDLNYSPNKQDIAIDPYQSTVWDNAGRLVVEKAGLSSYVDIREGFLMLSYRGCYLKDENSNLFILTVLIFLRMYLLIGIIQTNYLPNEV